eukprot:CAMPEP_0201524832 /NCGR_PEP_ID=MMETSP0161_2-20130828/25410_1 /ASSEMBLY_ACC=CAM_ASM_000251 /TAXON_ID=180227 /ORGANISM="Neoparamoeba aestuarina, Strain SoJaBio B1-5/56/2" /LENGTH=136 /DNA_ID=CAMNT_0047924431 /DNA_START=46 /DNA_END=453 /DNA_ORIENTATION=-
MRIWGPHSLYLLYHFSREIEDGLDACGSPPPSILVPCPSCLQFDAEKPGEWKQIINDMRERKGEEKVVGEKKRETWMSVGNYSCENNFVDFVRSERAVVVEEDEKGKEGEKKKGEEKEKLDLVLLMGDVFGRACVL